MIEISHKQAQHLIRLSADRRLPEEQWAVLEAHLERCPDCRLYHDRLVSSERQLGHALRLRWASARGPAGDAAKHALKVRARRQRLKRFFSRAIWVALAALALFAFLVYQRMNAPLRQPVTQSTLQALETIDRTAEPTQPPITFRGLVAFEASQDGNSDIFLLNGSGGRSDVTNLTTSPANETYPAWSPDGEWVAFLSDSDAEGQPGGKQELYVLTVAGSRLTRLTARSDVEWRGPLEWSADGRYIALTGLRGDQSTPFLYLAPTNGEAPFSIAGTRGALPWARFSNSLPLLAFPDPENAGSLRVINVETGWTALATDEDAAVFNFRVTPGNAFDWSLGGRSLVYAAGGPFEPLRAGQSAPQGEQASMLRISPELDASDGSGFLAAGADTIDRAPTGSSLRAVSWAPNSLLVASLYDNDGCWALRLSHAYNRQVAQREFPGLCVEGGLERSSWTTDGSWLVVIARLAEESTPAIYAVRIDENGREDAGAPLYEKLAALDLGPELPLPAALPLDATLRVRPLARSLGLSPLPPEAQPQGEPQATALPNALQDVPVFYTAREEGQEVLYRMDSDGVNSAAEALTGPGADSACPRVGPPGSPAANLLAYVQRAAGGFDPSGAVYVQDLSTQASSLLAAAPELAPDGSPFAAPPAFSCPVWSPDGARLAAYYGAGEQWYLVVMAAPQAGGEPVGAAPAPVKYLSIDGAGLSAPAWLPDGQLLMVTPRGRQSARLLSVDVDASLDGQPPVTKLLSLLAGWDDAWGLSLSPDGEHLALVMVYYNLGSRLAGPSIAQLRVLDAGTLAVLGAASINNFDPFTVDQGALGWLPDDRVGLVRTVELVGSVKSVFERFDYSTGSLQNRMETITGFEDLVYDAAWSDEGVIFAAESGLYALDYQAEALSAPRALNGQAVTDVEWRLR